MDNLTNVTTVAHVIQQAVAPVFLLSGIGSILTILSTRLARVIDRFRKLNEHEGGDKDQQNFHEETPTLSSRARWLHWSISLCTLSALCICLLIATLFIAVALSIDLSNIESALFVLAMLGLILGLLCFLRDIALSTGIIETQNRNT